MAGRLWTILFFMLAINLFIGIFQLSASSGNSVIAAAYTGDEWIDTPFYNISHSNAVVINYLPYKPNLNSTASLVTTSDSYTGINIVDSLLNLGAAIINGLYLVSKIGVYFIESVVLIPLLFQEFAIPGWMAYMMSAPFYVVYVLALIRAAMGRTLE